MEKQAKEYLGQMSNSYSNVTGSLIILTRCWRKGWF